MRVENQIKSRVWQDSSLCPETSIENAVQEFHLWFCFCTGWLKLEGKSRGTVYILCVLGYNDFNNLVMQTLWWLPIKILRHIHKKRFSIFLNRFLRICNQSVQKVLIRVKKIFVLKKFNMGIKKRSISRWFRIRWKSFEKMHPKKVISKNVTGICTSFTFTHVRQIVLLVTFFFVNFFKTFSTDSKSAWNSAFFDTHIEFFNKKIFWVILALFANFEAKCAKNGSKNKKTYFVNVS